MKVEKFNEIIEDQMNICKEVLIDKAKQYATEDRLHNFKNASVLENSSPITALAGMMAKHTISIYDMCSSNMIYPIDLWEEKITDHINYLLILKALVQEV